MTFVDTEIASQPDCWRAAVKLAATDAVRAALPLAGERIAVVGCGTSYYMAQAFAVLRETAGLGETDAFAASEFPGDRTYDRIVALTRSGTTTEVRQLLTRITGTPTSVIVGDITSPVLGEADAVVELDFADEQSVVQTRFATSALAMWRAWLGEDLSQAIADAERALTDPIPTAALVARQFTFLGTGWTVGLAAEAGLKLREASQSWTESYPAMEFRHGPISVIDDNSVVWVFGQSPEGLRDDVAGTGCLFVESDLDPMAQLVLAQRLAVGIAKAKGLDPDAPRNLTRSIVLDA